MGGGGGACFFLHRLFLLSTFCGNLYIREAGYQGKAHYNYLRTLSGGLSLFTFNSIECHLAVDQHFVASEYCSVQERHVCYWELTLHVISWQYASSVYTSHHIAIVKYNGPNAFQVINAPLLNYCE